METRGWGDADLKLRMRRVSQPAKILVGYSLMSAMSSWKFLWEAPSRLPFSVMVADGVFHTIDTSRRLK
jgi:hypothetical protein